MKILLRVMALVLFIGTLASCDKTDDFTTLCGYFDALEKELQTKQLSSYQKFSFINNQVIKNLPADSAASESWNAVLGFVQVEGRYELFKNAAETTINGTWQCDSMQALLKDI